MHQGKGEEIMLYGIDCPEKRQAFGQKAKRFTSDMVFGKIVEVEPVDVDRYARTFGPVLVGDQCLNESLVESGFAWVYEKYCKRYECKEWQWLEAKAREKKVGLWQDKAPVPPWKFRKTLRQ